MSGEKELGMVHVYTGDGKGKTTAALGLGMRAAGHGYKVLMIQFMKGQINYGELEAAASLTNFEIVQYGRPDFVDKENPAEIDIKLARDGLEHAKKAIEEKVKDAIAPADFHDDYTLVVIKFLERPKEIDDRFIDIDL